MIKHNTEVFFIKLGENIANIRRESGLTQEQLAKLINSHQPVIASYEIGRRRIPVPVLIKISNALHVYVEDLLPLDQNKKKRGPRPKIDKELEKVKILPEEQQKAILNLIETFTKSNLKAS